MRFKKATYLSILFGLVPITCSAQGIQQGIEDFLFVTFGVVTPSIVLLTLFFLFLFKKLSNKAPFIHILSGYLAVICSKYLIRYIYLYDRRSSIARRLGANPDMSDEIIMILGCIIGLVSIAIITFLTINNSRKV